LRRHPRFITALALALTLSAPANAWDADTAAKRSREKRVFTDQQIADGFFQVTFGAELQIGGTTDRIRKYDGPVRVYVDSKASPDRSAVVAAVVADIGRRVANLDIAITLDRNAANIVVSLIRSRQLAAELRSVYGAARARQIIRRLDPVCLSSFRKEDDFRIANSNVFLIVDVDDFTLTDCAYEEILQALGPINDTRSVPWTMFNDNVRKGYFGVYDQYLLNMLYHPRVRPGATRNEIRALLPQIMPEVRSWVAKVNGLSP
jgi:hypothetical protein